MTPDTAAAGPIRATLIDIANCIGCRACQVACKQWNERDGEDTQLEPEMGIQNPAVLSAKTYTLIAFHEMENPAKPGGLDSAYVMQRCLHCLEPACVTACPTTALQRQPDGPVSYEVDECIGCRYCMLACPWDVPTADWNTRAPKISKCTHCADRAVQPPPVAFNDQALSEDAARQFANTIAIPACVKACPADALRYGTRDEMLALAHKRIADRPDKYVDHVYGEKELGGTSVLYLSRVPFEKLGFPMYGEKPFTTFNNKALGSVPPAVIAVGALLGASYAFFRKRVQAVADAKHHVEFEPVQHKLLTPFNWILLLLMAFGAITFVARFALGLGATTNLSDTYPWGLWILFDLVWIAVAAGAFAMAGIIYVLQRKDLYGLGRSAVLMGVLSYSFVMVTLLADLGLPWNSYQLALQAPAHSAMFEVSWCVGLYITILILEFLPVPFAHWGYDRAAAALRRWNGAYVAGAVTLFVYLLSRNLLYAAGAAVVFGTLAWIFRARDHKAEPIMLAIAAVTLSTMHQSSLGLPVSADAEHAGAAVVVAGDAGLLLPVVDRGRHRARDPHRHVDLQGMAAPARDDTAGLSRTDRLLGDARVPRVSPRRHGDPEPARWRLLGTLRHGVRGRDRPRRRAAAAPAVSQVASAASRPAVRRIAPRRRWRGLQPHERRPLCDELPRPHALGRCGKLFPVDSSSGAFRSV